MTTSQPKPAVVARADVPPDRRRGAELRVMLSPGRVDSTSGFMGVATLRPGERIAEHWHPYSEEFLYVVRGRLVVDLDGEPTPVEADQGLYIPIGVRHRLRNGTGDAAGANGSSEDGEDTVVVFHLGPLAPRPALGHVDTETAEEAARAEPSGREPA